MPMGRSWMPAWCRLMPRIGELHLSLTKPVQEDWPISRPNRRVCQLARKLYDAAMQAGLSKISTLHVLISSVLFRRPTYTITCNGGEQQEVPDEALQGLREPKSPMMPDATPPSIAAPSPSDGTPMEDDTPPGRAAPPSPRPPTHSFHTQPNPQAPFAASRPTAVPGESCVLM